MKLSTIAIGCVLSALMSHAAEYALPAERAYAWEAGVTAGVVGGIPDTSGWTVVNVVSEGVDNTGATDVASAVQALITAATAETVIYFPAGTYRIDTGLTVGYKDEILLKGAGMDVTFFDYRGTTGGAITLGGDADYLWDYPNVAITGSPAAGATVLTMDTTGFTGAEGFIGQIDMDDDLDLPVIHVASHRRRRKIKVQIVSMTATTITIQPPLPFALPSSLNPKFNVATNHSENSGIEDMTVDCTNATDLATSGVGGSQCVGSWFRRVKVSQVKNVNFGFGDSVLCEMRECYADQRTAAGIATLTNGSGLLMSNCTGMLIEDNIFYKNFPLIEMNVSTASVVAYNLFHIVALPGDGNGVAIDTNHGPHGSYNLIEGNVSPNLQCDGYFGGASEDTVFRNWFHGECNPGSFSNAILLQRFTRNYNIIGNIFGQADGPDFWYSLGLPNMGNSESDGTAQLSLGDEWDDWAAGLAASAGAGPGPNGFQEIDLDVEATLLRKGNRKLGTVGAIDAGESLSGDTLATSLFRSSKPSYFGSLNWPAFDASVAQDEETIQEIAVQIPAGYRYFIGELGIGKRARMGGKNIRIGGKVIKIGSN